MLSFRLKKQTSKNLGDTIFNYNPYFLRKEWEDKLEENLYIWLILFFPPDLCEDVSLLKFQNSYVILSIRNFLHYFSTIGAIYLRDANDNADHTAHRGIFN